jgi:predicted nucleic acid-binding protein
VIVLDASALIELMLTTAAGRAVAARIADPAVPLHVPHLVDVEVAQALRRLVAAGELYAGDALQAIGVLRDLPLDRHRHDDLLDRVWGLRGNLSAYDAVYVALAEALGAVLVTCDRKLAGAPGVRARVEFVAG